MKFSTFLTLTFGALVLASCASNNNLATSSVKDGTFQSAKRTIASEDKLEASAKKTIEDFIFAVANNSDGINIKSNWDKLFNKLKESASQSLIESLLDDKDETSFNNSLMRVMEISATAQTLARLPSGPKIIETHELDEGKTKFIIKPYNSDLVEVYEATCTPKEVRGFFGGKSIKYSCQVTGLEFSNRKH